MYPSETVETDVQQSRQSAWGAIRWLIAVAASFILVTLFLTQGTTTEAAAPTATDTAVYHEMDATCQQGFNCIANNCSSGNYYFCGYNLNFNYPYNFNFANGCGLGGLNCGINFVSPSFVSYPFPNRFVNNFPIFLNPNNNCATGNFSCYNANVCGNGNFSCANANFPFVGNTFFGTGIFGNPFFFGGAAGVPVVTTTTPGVTKTTITSNTGQVVLYTPRELAQPVAAPVAQTAAPAAPAANYATALNAPVQAPAAAVTSGGGDIHVLSAAPTTKPAVSTDTDDHRG